MARYIDVDILNDKINKICTNCGKMNKNNGVMCNCCYLDTAKELIDDMPTEDVVSIKQIINEIDELYYDFENSNGNLTTFIIDVETLHTDVGYAIVGIEFYKNILKKRISKYCGAKMEESQDET